MKKTGIVKLSESFSIIGYTRLSKQEIEGRHTLSMHCDRLKKAGCNRIYWDIISRSSKKREGLEEVLKMIAQRACKKIILIRLDRLTDNLGLMENFIDLIVKTNVECIGIDDKIDLSSVGGRTHARLLVALSRDEIERTGQRLKNGWADVRKRGRAVNPPFAYYLRDGKYEVDRRPFLCLLNGNRVLSKYDIARELIEGYCCIGSARKVVRSLNQRYGIWHSNHSGRKTGFIAAGGLRISGSGLARWIEGEVLRGNTAYPKYGEIIFNTHEAIITSEEWEAIKRNRDRSKKGYGFGACRQRYPLSGLVNCVECGGRCYASVGGKRNGKYRSYHYYKCKNASNGACSNKKMVRADRIERYLVNKLSERAKEIGTLANQAEIINEETDRARLLRSQIEQMSSIGDSAPIKKAIEELKQELVLEQSKDARQVYDIFISDRIYQDPEYWLSLSNEDKIVLYADFTDAVYVYEGKPQSIKFK